MTQICWKSLRYVIKWLSCVGNGLNLWEIAQKYDQWILCVGNGLNKCEMAQKCGKRLFFWSEVPQIYWKSLKYMINGLHASEMA